MFDESRSQSVSPCESFERVAVIGAGSWGTAIAVVFARSGANVLLGCRTRAQATLLAEKRVNQSYLPDVPLTAAVTPTAVVDLDFSKTDLLSLAVPSPSLANVTRHAVRTLPRNAGVLLLTKGLLPPDGQLPCEYVGQIIGETQVAVLGGPTHAGEACVGVAGPVIASRNPRFLSSLRAAFTRAGLSSESSDDVVGVQLAGCAKNVAALAAAIALRSGTNAAGMAAGRIWKECYEFARSLGADDRSFAGVAGIGDLVATVLCERSRNRRAGELLSAGMSVERVAYELGQTAEAMEVVSLLAESMQRAGFAAPATVELAKFVNDRRGPNGRTPPTVVAHDLNRIVI